MSEELTNQLQELKQLTLLGAKNVLSVADLSLLTGLSKSHIYKLICSKKIPHYKSEGGKLVFFRKDEVENWLCALKVPTATEVEQAAINHCVTNKAGGNYGN
jgi:excisionase family DNA binding protein